MIDLPANARVWIVARHTDMRKGVDGLAALAQTAIAANPFCGHVFVFRGRRGDIIKRLRFNGQGSLLLAERLERGRFDRPPTKWQPPCGAALATPTKRFEWHTLQIWSPRFAGGGAFPRPQKLSMER